MANRKQPTGHQVRPSRLFDDDLNTMLDDIDDVLEEDAEAFVRSYVQRGGNGGAEVDALFERWVHVLGPERANDVLILLADLSLGHQTALELLELRYGRATARYFEDALHSLPGLVTRIAEEFGLHEADEARERVYSELAIRSRERDRDLIGARRLLDEFTAAWPTTGSYLIDEYKYLTNWQIADYTEGQAGSEVASLIYNLKRCVAPHTLQSSTAPVKTTTQAIGDVFGEDLEPRDLREVQTVRTTAHERGAALEDAALGLFRQIFSISGEEAGTLLERLRKQRSGNQFGSDLHVEFSATTARRASRCRVECKNYSRPIAMGDISDKLLQQDESALNAPIDHWILISPHVGVSNELQGYLDRWRERRRFSFHVHVWTPDTGVDQFFALEPELYRAIYDTDPPAPVDSFGVVERILSQLAPLTRIDASLERYLAEGWRMCFSGEDADHFENLLDDHVPLYITDTAGRPSKITVTDEIHRWVDGNGAQVMLLLADFGAGKSFSTYQTARDLAHRFIDDPSSRPYPLRLALRELHAAGGPAEFLARWLGRIGATEEAWWSLAASHAVVVFLDGFDEMTAELDPPTVSANLRLLYDVVEYILGPTTGSNANSKVVVTSRGRFFDQPQEEAVLRERLRNPQIVRLRPVSRTDALAHLTKYATRTNQLSKLEQIRHLYDPIGLAAKPLFLQMIRDTLSDLPTDAFGATTLYATFVQASLKRKIELLESGEPYELHSTLIERLGRVLELVAVEFHRGGEERVDLRAVEHAEGGDVASLLWSLTTTRAVASADPDALARVSIRSLLTPHPSEDTTAWLVSFFHRSMQEYFLALAIVRALDDDDVTQVRNALARRPLSSETVDFVGELAAGAAQSTDAQRLMSLARGARVGLAGEEALGGNAITLLHRLDRFPEERNWDSLNLDYAALDGADLSGCSFRDCSLRYAKLDNADLRDADLTGADIRGIRVEQTARVDAIAADLESESVFAVYSDGVIRKWEMRAGGRWVPTIVFEGLETRAREIAVITPQFAIALLERELLVFATTVDRPWTVLSRAPISPFLLALGATPGGVAALHHADRSELCIVAVGTAELEILQIEGVAGPLNYLQTTGDQSQLPESLGNEGDRSVFARVRGWWLLTNYWMGGQPVDATLWDLRSLKSRTVVGPQNATTVDVDETPDGGLLFVGTGDGYLWFGAWDSGWGDVRLVPFGDGPQHDGPVSALKVLSRGKVVSGGHDRAIRVVDIRRTGRPDVLFLTLRCRGIVLDSVTGDEERATLAALAEADVS